MWDEFNHEGHEDHDGKYSIESIGRFVGGDDQFAVRPERHTHERPARNNRSETPIRLEPLHPPRARAGADDMELAAPTKHQSPWTAKRRGNPRHLTPAIARV